VAAGGYDPQLEAAAQAGELGTSLLPSDAALLQLKPLRRFCAHELVAYSRAVVLPMLPASSSPQQQHDHQGPGLTSLLLPPPTIAAAAAAARRAAATTARVGDSTAPETSSQSMASADAVTSTAIPAAGTSAEGSEPSPSPVPIDLLYGRVTVNAEPAGDTPLYRVQVEVEPGVVVPLLSTQVWCFRTPTAADTHTAAGAAQGAEPHEQVGAPLASAAGRGSGAGAQQQQRGQQQVPHTPAAAGSSTGAAVPSSVPSTSSPPVGPPELVSAVKELLGAAGLPLDLGRQELLKQTTELQAALRTSRGALEEAQAAAARHQAELEAAKSAWSCKICFTRDVDAAFAGCGHMVSAWGWGSGITLLPVALFCIPGLLACCPASSRCALLFSSAGGH
jgi:sacsin